MQLDVFSIWHCIVDTDQPYLIQGWDTMVPDWIRFLSQYNARLTIRALGIHEPSPSILIWRQSLYFLPSHSNTSRSLPNGLVSKKLCFPRFLLSGSSPRNSMLSPLSSQWLVSKKLYGFPAFFSVARLQETLCFPRFLLSGSSPRNSMLSPPSSQWLVSKKLYAFPAFVHPGGSSGSVSMASSLQSS
ncbi:hypothetical protein GE061_003740 [Apolygus lucorum]|uniref:Uncharacterized protein n=1 Tax=Apolygus lucorum TaxID=248454 RepID=A0A8S9X2W5_APOLU|nr:hypothetical protein GE061_003740 [Apolygus lucorum]